MKMRKYVMIMFLLLLLPAYSYPSTFGSIHISLIKGDVQIRTEDTGEWVPATINMPLVDGDRIWVPEGGKTELQLRDGTSLRLDENSALEILTIEKDSFQFYLTEGRGYANFRGLRGSLLQIDTPVSSIRVYDRSNLRIETTQDGYTNISVYMGVVYAENRDGRTRVDGGKTLSIREGIYAELSPLGPPDEWERWNRERDRRLAEIRLPSRYLPDELQAYSSDLEENGRWVLVREYGYVWTPTVVISAGWAPYRIGRWVWIGGDYVWVSYEPWGWAPYHYGRWAFISTIGWCWVPPARGAVYWGPGFVGWVRTPTHVSWVPLAPREIYYGRRYYGPHSVNITNINITNIQVSKIVYKNVHVTNSVTVVHHDTFVTGRHVDVKVRENPFLKERILIGSPNIKPEKATRMPVVKEIPQTKRPPEPIREIKVKELKEKRPLVREKGGSVIKPGSPPMEMPLKVKEGKPVERDIEKIRGQKPAEKDIGKSREIRTPEKGEKSREIIKEGKPTEKGVVEKPKGLKPPEKGVEKIRESKPPEKGAEKPGLIEKQIEKPKEFKPAERGVEKPKESKPADGGAKPREIKPMEKGVEKPSVIEKESERSKEIKPSERGVEKSQKGLDKSGPTERSVEKPKEHKPPEKEVEKQGERREFEEGIKDKESPRK